MNMNVGIWIRVSTEDQARGESPKHHEARARMYAELKGWAVTELYDLSGVSGKDVLDHGEAKRMLADISSGRIKSLIFSKIPRLARNTRQLLEIADYFQKYDANLVSLEENIDTSSPAGRLLYTLTSALAQWEREEISARVAASIPIRAKLGKHIGGKGPFGYHWVEGQLIPNSEELPVVKRAYQIFLETGKLLTTCNRLKEEGLYSRSKTIFKPTSLKRLLSDTIYKGLRRANYAKSLGNKKSWILKPEEDWVFVNVQPLVSEEDWNAVNKIFEETAGRYSSLKTVPKAGKFLFSGILKCRCGAKLYVAPYPAMKIPRYACKKCRLKINEDVIEGNLRNALKRIVITPDQLGPDKDLKKELKDKQELLEHLKKEQKNVNHKIDVLIDLYGKEAIDQSGFKDRYEPLKARAERITLEIPRLQAQMDFIKTNEIGKTFIIEKASTLATIWDTLSNEARRQVVKELIERIDVSEDSLHFVFFYVSSFEPVGKGSHSSMGVCTFSYYPSKRYSFSIRTLLQKQPAPGYPEHLLTIGDHIRKKRMDLGLLQREAAKIIGVKATTIWNWEHGTEPEQKYNPRIINFLGYIPFDCPDDIMGRLAWYKRFNGLSLPELGRRMNRHPDQLRGWLSGERRPFARNIESIEQFLGNDNLTQAGKSGPLV